MLAPVQTDAFLDDLNAAVHQVRLLPRVRFEIDMGEDAERWIRKKHAANAVHEPATLAAFLTAVKHHPVRHVFDLGALYGYFTLFALQAFDNVEVTAFDMHPRVIMPLLKNVRPYAKVVHAVVSDELRKDMKFWISGFNIYEEPEGGWDKLADIPGAMKQRGENNRGRGFVEVPFITLDAYCKGTGAAPDLIKIDVEGYQAKAVKGALGIIKERRPVIVIELHDPEKLERFGVTNAQTVQPLYDMGYRGYWCPNFRDRDARYEAVAQMGPAQEQLCIMVFVP